MRNDRAERTRGESSLGIFGDSLRADGADYPDHPDPDYRDPDYPDPDYPGADLLDADPGLNSDYPLDDDDFADTPTGAGGGRRADRYHENRRRRARRRSRLVAVVAVVVIAVVAVAGFVIVKRIVSDFGVKDYAGQGSGQVLVQVHAGDASSDIAATLVTQGVVASSQAFINAARSSGQSQDFQPGFFNLRQKMSGKAAVAMLLDASSRVSTKVTIPEGMTVAAICQLLATKLHLKVADLTAAAADLPNLGVPDGFSPKSAEGFLLPQTYDFDPNLTAAEALQQITSQFQAQVRELNFAAAAKALGYSEYQVLIVASLVEGESFFDEDRAKVARVVYNRLKARTPLGFDSTSAYGARLAGQDPRTVNYAKNTPYNTRNVPGLPPTPINNPGEKALTAALSPASGNWLYFVNKDKAGHLFFTNSYPAFVAAAQKCHVNGWGCDAQ